MKLPKFKKKFVASALAAGLVMGAGGFAAAYFTASGSGTGTAKTGTVSALKITQIGAGYDSLLTSSSSDAYNTSLCTACDGYTKVGNAITATPNATGYEQLTSVTVALVNFSTNTYETVTLDLTGGPNGPYSFTQTFSIYAGSATAQAVSQVKFTLANTEVFEYPAFKYSITLHQATTGVNVAMTKNTEVSVGTGTIEAYAATPSTSTLRRITSRGYVPAVEINDVGGVVPSLYPGAPAQPLQYAVTNPNAGPVQASIAAAVKGTGVTGTGVAGCPASWFSVTGSVRTAKFPAGTTIVSSSGLTIALETAETTQDACANQSIPVTFTATS